MPCNPKENEYNRQRTRRTNRASTHHATPSGTNRFQLLCFEQVKRLHQVMNDAIPVHGRGNFPTLEITLKDLVRTVRKRLRDENIIVKDIRLNGSGASYILGLDSVSSFNDIDLIFGVDLNSQQEMQKIKIAVLDSLLNFLPSGASRDRLSAFRMKDAYVSKLAKVWNNTDRWSLISLTNLKGRNIELKFVNHMKRQFEFSVDSFQIILGSLLTWYDSIETIKPTPPPSATTRTPTTEDEDEDTSTDLSSPAAGTISETFYPTVAAESVYGDFEEAFYHLSKKLIATRHPEEIRGGGLLRYCHMLVKGFRHADGVDVQLLKRYMCSRFFIDFYDLPSQKRKLEQYMETHFMGNDESLKYRFLMALHSIVDQGTICLMKAERSQILDTIKALANNICSHKKAADFSTSFTKNDNLKEPVCILNATNELVVEQIYYNQPVQNASDVTSIIYPYSFETDDIGNIMPIQFPYYPTYNVPQGGMNIEHQAASGDGLFWCPVGTVTTICS